MEEGKGVETNPGVTIAQSQCWEGRAGPGAPGSGQAVGGGGS